MNKSLLTENNKIRTILLVVLGIVVIMAVVLGIVISKNRSTTGISEDTQQGEGLAASLSSEEGELREVLQTPASADPTESPDKPSEVVKVPDGNFQITMTTEWNYPDINTPAEDSYVENAKNNTLDTRLSIVLAEDESVILYESPLLPVGSYTAGIPLKTELAPGTYDCVAIYTLYAPGSTESSGSVRVSLTINIGEGSI